MLALWRFHRSPLGSVLVAIRENEQRARFIGYPTDRYKLAAFVVSAGLTGLAGMLLLFNNRMTSAEPISVAFSGELLAMVIIGGMRSFLGPALGALFFVIFRDSLSRVTENWLLYFGLLFVAFVVFSPDRAGRPVRAGHARWRRSPPSARPRWRSARRATVDAARPSCKPAAHGDGDVILAVERLRQELRRHPRGARTCRFGVRDRTLHALIGPNGAGKTTAFNLISGMFAPDRGTRHARRAADRGTSPRSASRARASAARSRSPTCSTSLVGGGERAPRGAGARPAALLVLDRRGTRWTTSTARPPR